MSMDIGKEKTPGYTFNHIENDTIDPNPTPKERIVGVSIWLPPAPTLSPWTTLTQECLLTLKQLLNNIRFLGRGGLNLRRYWIWKSQQKQAHDDILWDPSGYYFCTFLAVSEEVRGRGVGKRLVEMVTRRADKEGISCYLESSKRVPNVAIYRRMGFEVVREIRCFDSHSEGDSGSGGGEGCTVCLFIFQGSLWGYWFVWMLTILVEYSFMGWFGGLGLNLSLSLRLMRDLSIDFFWFCWWQVGWLLHWLFCCWQVMFMLYGLIAAFLLA